MGVISFHEALEATFQIKQIMELFPRFEEERVLEGKAFSTTCSTGCQIEDWNLPTSCLQALAIRGFTRSAGLNDVVEYKRQRASNIEVLGFWVPMTHIALFGRSNLCCWLGDPRSTRRRRRSWGVLEIRCTELK